MLFVLILALHWIQAELVLMLLFCGCFCCWQIVVALDPDEYKEYLDVAQNRSKERRYVFDAAFDVANSNEELYQQTVAPLIDGVFKVCFTNHCRTTKLLKTYTHPRHSMLGLIICVYNLAIVNMRCD